MKKIIPLLIVTSFIVLSGCTNEDNNSLTSSKRTTPPVYDKIDVDMSTMNETKLSLTYDSFCADPGYYKNKVVKVKGPFEPSESTDENYCFPAIYLFSDATGCCPYVLEFYLYNVPVCSMAGGNGYPLYHEEATIVGTFERYYEDGTLFFHLVDALWLKDQ